MPRQLMVGGAVCILNIAIHALINDSGSARGSSRRRTKGLERAGFSRTSIR